MSAYVQAAMQTARFDTLSNGGWFGALPRFHAVMACAPTEEACYQALQADLERAIAEALQHHRPLPAFVGVTTPALEVDDVRS
ncbi:MAG: hypothetical protein M3R24_12800 [Chloroflexota bacterium]|nr:hypothetical protein [Chloroflexota bacterium]